MAIRKNKLIAVATALILTIMTALSFTSTADNSSLTYIKYNARTGAFLGSYVLPSMPSSDNSRSLIYDDNRVIDWSKSGVVKIISDIYYSDSNEPYRTMGTGFVVDEHTIATAAHVAFQVKLDHIELYNSNGSLSLSATPVETHVPYNYASATNKPMNFDYALITVSEDLSNYMCFDLAVPIQTGMSASITGFPGTVYPNGVDNGGSSANGNMYTGTGMVSSISDGIIHCASFSSEGASGSPVYVSESYGGRSYNSVIGINTAVSIGYTEQGEYVGREALGPVMTFDIIHFLSNNTNKSH